MGANCELLYFRRIRKVLVLRRPVLPCLQVEVLCALKLPTWLALSLQVPPLFLWLPGLGFRVQPFEVNSCGFLPDSQVGHETVLCSAETVVQVC